MDSIYTFCVLFPNIFAAAFSIGCLVGITYLIYLMLRRYITYDIPIKIITYCFEMVIRILKILKVLFIPSKKMS